MGCGTLERVRGCGFSELLSVLQILSSLYIQSLSIPNSIATRHAHPGFPRFSMTIAGLPRAIYRSQVPVEDCARQITDDRMSWIAGQARGWPPDATATQAVLSAAQGVWILEGAIGAIWVLLWKMKLQRGDERGGLDEGKFWTGEILVGLFSTDCGMLICFQTLRLASRTYSCTPMNGRTHFGSHLPTACVLRAPPSHRDPRRVAKKRSELGSLSLLAYWSPHNFPQHQKGGRT